MRRKPCRKLFPESSFYTRWKTPAGAISFVGGGRFGSMPGLAFPTTVDGGPSNRYLAGTFQFDLAPPTITKAFDRVVLSLGASTVLTFTITNANLFLPLTGVTFTDTLPAGLVVSTPAAVTNTCNGTVTATAGTGMI